MSMADAIKFADAVNNVSGSIVNFIYSFISNLRDIRKKEFSDISSEVNKLLPYTPQIGPILLKYLKEKELSMTIQNVMILTLIAFSITTLALAEGLVILATPFWWLLLLPTLGPVISGLLSLYFITRKKRLYLV